MDTWLQDLRFASRAFRRQPGTTLMALITLALGIGATTAIFSVVYAMLRPLPYDQPDRIVGLSTLWTKTGVQGPVSAPDFHDWREQSRSFDSMAYFFGGELGVVAGGGAEYATTLFVTPGFFRTLGFQPRMGRLLTADEERRGGPMAAVITDAFWRRQFGADPGVLNATLKIGARVYTVVGVLAPGARYPARADAYVAATTSSFPENPNRSGHNYRAVGRLAPGVTLEQARTDMTAIAARLGRQYPGNADKSVAVTPLHETIVGDLRVTLYVLLGAVSLVLLIACANVANLLLARATARTREIAVRVALGARRRRLLRQLLTESATMALLAAIGGVLLAYLGVTVLVAVAPQNLPRLNEVAINSTALAFALIAALGASIVFGLAPAVQLSRMQSADQLRQAGTGSTSATPRNRARSAFVVAEVTFAVVLVTGALLLGRSLGELAAVDLGFNTDRVLTLRTTVPLASLDEAPRATLFYREVLPQIRSVPGVRSAGAVFGLPTRSGSTSSYAIEGGAEAVMRPGGPSAALTVVTPEYFQTMGVRLVAGRDFSEADRLDAPFVAVINEALARRSFSGQNPIGHRIRNGLDSDEFMTIVGVVRDVRTYGPAQAASPEIYMPFEQHPGPASAMTIVVRTASDPLAVAPAITAAIRKRSADVPIAVDTLEGVLATATAAPRFRTYLFATFAVVALVLAMAGVYGVVAFTVSQRAREIGLRVALGARPADIMRLVVGHGGRLTALGIVLGIGLSLALSRLISRMLFGVTPTDPVVLAVVVAAIAGAALVACCVPALLALRIRPMGALRAE